MNANGNPLSYFRFGAWMEMEMGRWRRIFLLLLLLAGAGLLSGAYFLYSSHSPTPVARSRPSPSPPEVTVTTVRPRSIPLPLTYAGRVAGFRDVEVRAQVGGILIRRAYDEGSRVTRGQTLFRIDPQPYEVALDRAKAQLAQVQAMLVQSGQNFKRTEELSRRQVATEKQLDDARAARDQADASVKLAEAEVRSATLNLGYTTVSAPVAGMTSLRSPPEGTLILAQQTLLTTITQLDPAYVNIAVTDEEFKSLREMNRRRQKPITAEDIAVELHYSDSSQYSHLGRLDVAASTIELQTGTVQIRTIFPNPNGTILPGQFVRVVLRGITLSDAILIPKRAVSQGPQGPFVYVAANGKAEVRLVRLGRELNGDWVVEEGLKEGEQVIVDGTMRVRPGISIRLAVADISTQVAK